MLRRLRHKGYGDRAKIPHRGSPGGVRHKKRKALNDLLSELRSCVKVEPTVSVDVKQDSTK